MPIAPPVEEAPAAPMPLVLTARERKKMRTQRRMEREKERQVGLQAACDAETHRQTDRPAAGLDIWVVHVQQRLWLRRVLLACQMQTHCNSGRSYPGIPADPQGGRDSLRWLRACAAHS